MSAIPSGHVVVIGSGIAGAAAAFSLAARGLGVTVVDSDADGPATAAGAGIVQPWASTAPGAYYDLYAAGADYYPTVLNRLHEAGGDPVDFRRSGSLVVSTDTTELDDVAATVRSRAATARLVGDVDRLSEDEAAAEFPPLGPGYKAVRIAGGARVDGRSLRAGLLSAAGSLGAGFITGVAALDDAGQVSIDDRRAGADAVVVAAGAWTPAVIAPLGRLDVYPQRGQIMHLRLDGAGTLDWPSVIPRSSHYLVAFGDSRIVGGATREPDSGFDVRTTAAGQHEILDNALTVAPGLATATVTETRVGLRPMADRPQIGLLPGTDNVYVNTGFGAGGLTMGPVSGEIIADLILNRRPAIDAKAFAPDIKEFNDDSVDLHRQR